MNWSLQHICHVQYKLHEASMYPGHGNRLRRIPRKTLIPYRKILEFSLIFFPMKIYTFYF